MKSLIKVFQRKLWISLHSLGIICFKSLLFCFYLILIIHFVCVVCGGGVGALGFFYTTGILHYIIGYKDKPLSYRI